MKRQRRAAPSIKAKALQWLSQREHSRMELRGKLLRWMQREAAAAAEGAAATDSTDPAGGAACDAREAVAAWREQSAAQVDALLDELEAARYLSDARFVESRIHARQARFGNRRIEQELREHGLQVAAQDKALLRETETVRARQVLQQRFADESPQGLGPADRQRRTRFLAARGFSFEAIQAALRLPED